MITKYGLPQVIIFPALTLALGVLLAVLLPYWWIIPIVAVIFIVFCWELSFFRDPPRKIKPDAGILYSACDGTVTHIVNEDGIIKISCFLSLFSVHINRAPCSGSIESVTYKKGQFRDARDSDSSQINESNAIVLTRSDEPYDKITVVQVSGAVARHIVCAAKPGDTVKQGEKLGMIKFGSRTDVILPDNRNPQVLVKVGDKVRAGITPIVKYLNAEVGD